MFIRNEHDEQGARGLFTRRAAVLALAQTVGFGVLAGRLYQLQVMEGNRFAPLADSNRTTRHALAPIRGLIYDRAGRVLADNIEDFRLTFTPSLAKGQAASVLDAAAQVIQIPPEDLERVKKRAVRQSPNIPIVVIDKLTFDQVARISVFAPELPGIDTELVGQRRYFNGRSMGHLVGYVGSVERFALDDDPILRLPGMRVGKIGVEHSMEMPLRGTGGHVKREVDARGRVVRDIERKEPQRGRDIVLAVDTSLQSRILKKLSRIRQGAAVAMRVDTGEIMAMASWPNADITDLGEGITQEVWSKLAKRRGNPLFNRTIRGLYPPGSTFKMITALAALEAREVTLGERIRCEGTYHYSGQRYRCWNRSGHGLCNMHRAIRESCDVYFYEIAKRVGIEKISEMGERFGLGQTYEDAGLAFQKEGIMPTPAWKRGRFGKQWYKGETLIGGIGQGFVATTPLQLAVMTVRLATGHAVVPRAVMPEAGLFPETPTQFSKIDVDPRHLRAVQRAMRAVVYEGRGTGKRARMPGYGFEVAGKTGTSQVTKLSARRTRRYLPWRFRDHALFVSYAPYKDPKYAVAVIVEHGKSGGKTAAPLAREIMEEVVKYERESVPAFLIGDASDEDPSSGERI
ncbi:MAG: penicillin-binding protein 2 [Pseudomonadota bacterium]